MLVLSRKVGERILLGDQIVVTVLAIHGNRIRIGIEAPDSVRIRRSELQSFQTVEPTRTADLAPLASLGCDTPLSLVCH